MPKPCVSFAHFGFEPEMMALIRKLEYTAPTSIQAQAVPAALSGRDIIGIPFPLPFLSTIITSLCLFYEPRYRKDRLW